MEWTYTVWDEPRLVYVALPKVVNTAVKAALLESYVSDRKWANPHAGHIPYQETTPEQIRQNLPCHLVFTVVRNPFDRFVSFWTDKIAGDGWYDALGRLGFELGMGFEETARIAAKITDDRADPHFRSQVSRLYDRDERIVPDLVLRYESLAEDWGLMQELAGRRTKRPLKALASRRTSRHMPWRAYYTPVAEAAVAERYARDFDRLGYPDRVADGREGGCSAATTDPYEFLHGLRAGDLVIDGSGYDPVRDNLTRGVGAHYLSVGPNRGARWHAEDAVRLAARLAEHHRVLLVAPQDLDTTGLDSAALRESAGSIMILPVS